MADDLEKKADLQRESIRLEKEYQDSLKMSSSLSGQITAALNSQVDFRTEIGKKVKEHYKDLASSIKQLETSEDIGKKINQLEAESLHFSKSYKGVNFQIGKQKMIANNLAVESLKIAQAQQVAIEKVNEKATAFTDALGDGIDSALGSLKEIPVIGGMLSSIAKGPAKRLKGAFTDAGKSFVTDFSSNLKGGASMMESLSVAGSGAGKSLIAAFTGPQAIIAAVVAVIAAGVYAFYKVSAAAKQFREETGLLNSQTDGLEERFASVAASTAAIGGSIEDVSKAASTFSNQFEGTQMASKGVLTSMVAMQNSFGVSAEAQAKVNEQFQLMSGASAETAQNMIQTTIAAAEAAGVAPAAVMKDIAENAEAGLMYFQGSTAALSKAAIEARKMGTSIGEAARVSKGLLDFESSITNELEASAMLGTNLNFNKARALAADKDILGAQKAVVAEVSKLGDLTKLSVFEQEALAKAADMPIESLIRQQQIAERFSGIDDERLAAANALLDAGKAMGDITDADLEKEAIRLGNQKAMQSEFDNMGNQLSAVGQDLLMALMPIGKLVMSILMPLVALFKGIFTPIGAAIDGIMQALEPISGIMKDIFGEGDGIGSIFEFIGNILSGPIILAINVLSNGLKMVMSFVSGIYDVFKGILTGDFGLILDGIMSIGEGLLRYFAAIPMILWDTFTDLFPQLGSAITDFFTSIGTQMKDFFLGIIPDWIKDYFIGESSTPETATSDVKSDSSSIQAQKQLVDGGSINDGIVQAGKIITTSPEDTLIATKEPDNFLKTLLESSPLGMLASGIGGAASMLGMGGSTPAADNSQLVAKMDELIGAVRETKDVFLDGVKVTSGVSSVANKVGSNSYAI